MHVVKVGASKFFSACSISWRAICAGESSGRPFCDHESHSRLEGLGGTLRGMPRTPACRESSTPQTHSHGIRFRAALALIAAASLLCGCEIIEKVPSKPKNDRANATGVTLDVDPIMRGTVGAEAIMVGINPTVVRGYGIVVGLKGTGGRLMPAEVRAALLQEIARRSVADALKAELGMTPDQFLNSDETGVVVVEGVIPPGAPKGSKFDLRVSALPGTDSTSLEGGRLYSCDLHPGPLLVGSRQALIIASASGNVFINPFVEPGATARDSVNRLVGRILDGGLVTKDMPVKLRLANSSTSRARTIQSAVNAVFPREAYQGRETAHGENADSIAITIPPSYRKRTEEFLQLLRHASLDVSAPEVNALAVRRALVANPGSAADACWRFKAIGKRSLPVIQDLYDYPEEGPRLAALEAGAYLDDPTTADALLLMSREAQMSSRLSAIELLRKLGSNPKVDLALRELLDDKEPDVRLAAYETLVARKDPAIGRMSIDGKFEVDLVPSSQPMLYVSQSGRPRIAVFGTGLAVQRPITLLAWSDRLIVRGDIDEDKLTVAYRPAPGAAQEVQQIDPELSEFIAFLGHRTSVERPFPGLGLTYGETVGALHLLWRQGYLKSDFKAEQDRVLAAILRNKREDERYDRPEFDPEEEAIPMAADGTTADGSPSDLAAIPSPAESAEPVASPLVPRDTVPR